MEKNTVKTIKDIIVRVWNKAAAILTAIIYVIFGQWFSREKCAKAASVLLILGLLDLLNAATGDVLPFFIGRILGWALVVLIPAYFVFRFLKKNGKSFVERYKEVSNPRNKDTEAPEAK